jgi:hypothetical protein
MPAIELEGTTLLTNQFGYISMGEHRSFKYDAYFDI